jgi:hypothetical protein
VTRPPLTDGRTVAPYRGPGAEAGQELIMGFGLPEKEPFAGIFYQLGKIIMHTYKITGQYGPHWVSIMLPPHQERIRKIVGRYKKEADAILEYVRQHYRSKNMIIYQSEKYGILAGDMGRYNEYSFKVHKPETHKRDMVRIKRFNEFLENRGIHSIYSITPDLIQEFQVLYLKEHSRTSWNKILMLIKAILDRATGWDIIDYNPSNKIKSLKTDKNFIILPKMSSTS